MRPVYTLSEAFYAAFNGEEALSTMPGNLTAEDILLDKMNLEPEVRATLAGKSVVEILKYLAHTGETLSIGSGGGTDTSAAEILERSATKLVNTEATQLGQAAVQCFPNLTEAYFPNVVKLCNYASVFKECPNITEITDEIFPKLTQIGGNAFSTNQAITKVVLSGEITLVDGAASGNPVFSSNSALTEIRLPNFTAMPATSMIHQLSNLQLVDYGRTTQINNLNKCTALRTLIFRNTDAVVSISGYNATVLGGIYANPAASTIYVPQALLSDYEADAKWSLAKTAGVTFTAIEGSAYEL